MAMNDQVTEAARGNIAGLSQNAANAVPLPAVNAPRVLVSPAAPPAPTTPAPQGGPTASQAYSQAQLPIAGQNVAGLQIAHDQGASEGLGEVSGVVTDTSGATISKASVSLRAAPGGTIREVATGPDGRFRIADVPAGRYELNVTARGFMGTRRQLELKSRDLAMLDSVLTVGAESQTVTVETDNAPLQTTQAEASAANLVQDEKLPGRAEAVARVVMGDRMLSMDAAGRLYLSRDAGKSWKKIKPKWPGKAAQLAVVPAHLGTASEAVTVTRKAAGAAQLFELTTDAGAVWISEDGQHWRARTDGNQ
jgi:hypothetical protein